MTEQDRSKPEVVYDLLGFLDRKPVMQVKKLDADSFSKPKMKPMITYSNKAIGKFVILKNQHIKKVCLPPQHTVNLKDLKKVSNVISLKDVVGWSKMVPKIDAGQVVTRTDKKLLRTYSKCNPDKVYLSSASRDNSADKKFSAGGVGTLPVSISKNCNVGIFPADTDWKSTGEVRVNDTLEFENVEEILTKLDEVLKEPKETFAVKKEIRTEDSTGTLNKGDEPILIEDDEMGKIKHFKEKTQQDSVNHRPTGKQIYEEADKAASQSQSSEAESSCSNTPNRSRRKVKTKPNKRQMIRREIEKCLKQQSMKRSRRRRILEARQKSISCQTAKASLQEIATQTDEYDENMALLHLDEFMQNDGALCRDVNFGTGPIMAPVFAGKNLGNTPGYQGGYPDFYAQFGSGIGAAGSMCFDLASNNSMDTNKVVFYNYLKKCDQTDAGGNIPLHIAVMSSDLSEVTRQCLVLGLRRKSVDVPNTSGLTPLHVAVLNGCPVELIDALLCSGADPLAMDTEGNTSLHLAVSCRAKDVLVHLLKTVQNSQQSVDVFNYEGFTPLMLSVLEDEYDLVHECVKYGADPNTKDQKSGRTSLFHAVESNNECMVKLFIIHGANTKIKNFFGTSTHEATFELENIKPEIKALVVGRDSIPNKLNTSRSKKKRPPVEKFPEMKNKLKTVRVLKVIKVNNNKPCLD